MTEKSRCHTCKGTKTIMNMGMMRIKCPTCDGEGTAPALTAGIAQVKLSTQELREIIPKCEKISEKEPDMQQIGTDKVITNLDDLEKELNEIEIKKKRGRPPINRD